MVVIFEVALGLLLAIFAYLFWDEYKKRQKQEGEFLTRLNADSKQSIEETKKVIEQASKEAEELFAKVSQEGLKADSGAKLITQLFEQSYKKALDAAIKTSSEQLTAQMAASEKEFQNYLKTLATHSQDIDSKVNDYLKTSVEGLVGRFEQNLKTIQDRSVASQEESEQAMKTRVNDLLIKLEQDLSTFLSSSQQKSLEAVNLEVKSARELIDTYKQEQLKLVDENIVNVLEKTLSLVMRKKLSLQDQVDLVFESLEKAKAEKFLV